MGDLNRQNPALIRSQWGQSRISKIGRNLALPEPEFGALPLVRVLAIFFMLSIDENIGNTFTTMN
jgi:hypothetical protein